jgi:hypothetical protein
MCFSCVYSQWICGQCDLSSLLNAIMKMTSSQDSVRGVPCAKLQCKQRFVLIIRQTSTLSGGCVRFGHWRMSSAAGLLLRTAGRSRLAVWRIPSPIPTTVAYVRSPPPWAPMIKHVNMSLCLIKHHAMNTYWGMEAKLHTFTGHIVSSGNVSNFYSEGERFESWPGHWLFWLKSFEVFLSPP